MVKNYFFDKYLYEYLTFLKDIKNLSNNSIKAYERDISKFRDFIALSNVNKLIDISEDICTAWIGSLYSENISSRSCLLYTSPSPRD